MLSPSARRECVDRAIKTLDVSERRACSVIRQSRSTQRRRVIEREDEDALTQAIIRLASEYGRYGYRRVTALLKAEGWHVNHKRVARIWRREGLKVPIKQPKRGRLWLNDGSCIRLRPSWREHVWAYDFVHDLTKDGRSFRMLTVIDEYSRECLAIVTKRKLKSGDVLEALEDLFISAVFPIIFALITDRSLLPKRCAAGLKKWDPKPCTLSRALHGRTATMRASTVSSGMSF